MALYFLVVFGVERGVIPQSGLTEFAIKVGDKESSEVQEGVLVPDFEKAMLGEEKVDLVVTNYTNQINDICQELKITAQIENSTDVDINFEDVFSEDGSLFLDLVCEEFEEEIPFLATAKDWTGVKMTDFGTIQPGEKATIELTIIDEVQIIDESGNPLEVIYENPFAIVEKNGIYNLRLELGIETDKLNLGHTFENSHYILGKSNTFPVEVNVLSEPGFYKACAKNEGV